MTFEEYTKTDVFLKERARTVKNKRLAWLVLALTFFGTASILAGCILGGEDRPEEMWRLVLAVALVVAGLAADAVVAVLHWRKSARKDDGISRRPAFAVAYLLYAREYLSTGWHETNGAVTYDLDFPPVIKGKEPAQVTLVRGGERFTIEFSRFGEDLDAYDGLLIPALGLFCWLENNAVTATEISYRLLENGMNLNTKRGGKTFLYEAGKWKLTGRNFRREYRRIKKYACRKDILET